MHTSVINLSPKRETLDGTHFDWLIGQWLDHIAKNRTKRTHYDYSKTIQHFRTWWAEYGPQNNFILSAGAFDEFNDHLDQIENRRSPGRSLAWHTRNDALRRIKQIFTWAANQGFIDQDYSAWIPAPSGRLPEREPLPRDLLPRLMAASTRAENPQRARCVISLLGGTGMRRGEAIALNVEDIVHDSENIEYIFVRARLKNGRTRAVGIAPSAMKYVISFIDNRQSGPLFLGERGKGRANAKTIYRDCVEVMTLAGVNLSRPCHDLRVAFATTWARQRRGEIHGNILSTQLGHSHFETTRKFYIQTDIHDITETMINPFSDQEAWHGNI